ncbi:MAG TPA: transposase [Pyrinomonadaceae bacterium]|nr:transposase [Pyrinomonadaceae bacterium]
MAEFGEHWDDSEFPIAYLITIRTYGTWLHGDERSWVDTHGRYNVFGAVKRQHDLGLSRQMAENMKDPQFTFDKYQRLSVEKALKEVCVNRNYEIFAVNVRSNHAHAVVSAQSKPEPIANAFKSYATRALRRICLWTRTPGSGRVDVVDDIYGNNSMSRQR